MLSIVGARVQEVLSLFPPHSRTGFDPFGAVYSKQIQRASSASVDEVMIFYTYEGEEEQIRQKLHHGWQHACAILSVQSTSVCSPSRITQTTFTPNK